MSNDGKRLGIIAAKECLTWLALVLGAQGTLACGTDTAPDLRDDRTSSSSSLSLDQVEDSPPAGGLLKDGDQTPTRLSNPEPGGCDGVECCPAGTTPVPLTAGFDVFSSKDSKRCVVAMAGSDVVIVLGAQSAVLAGDGNDIVFVGTNGLIRGGKGDDSLYSFSGKGSLILGNEGRDTIVASNGADRIFPGPNADTVNAALGNDVVVLCDVDKGERLDGSGGVDELLTPISLSELRAAGVSVKGFEKVTVSTESCGAVCDPSQLDDGNPCTEDRCNVQTGTPEHIPLPDGEPCSDGSACTEADSCQQGECIGGPPPDCDDGNLCTDDSCEPSSGCRHENNTNPCADSNACTTGDTCSAGQCVGGPPPNCDDSNVCTDDTCEPTSGCVHSENAAPCDDGTLCTIGDHCAGGVCQGGGPLQCDDGNVCTDDICDPISGCINPYNTAPCEDGSACTTFDVCSDGGCFGGPPPDCSDGNPCTDDGCDAIIGCVNPHNTAPCDDGSACTTVDQCAGGSCQGGPPPDCDDGKVCTDDRCDPGVGCLNPDNTAPCDDGSQCTTADTCSAGSCVGGAPLNCNDGNVCTDDSCAPDSGCVHANNEAPCDDGELCTVGDTCQNKTCTGTPVTCLPETECEEPGTCDPATGQCVPGGQIPGCGLPPDPASIAPPLDPTVTHSLYDATKFLFESDTPVQTEVTPGAIDPMRASLLRGRVRTRDGVPLAGVSIEVLGSPQTGRTLSREDGQFDLIVNGGGSVVVKYSHADYLPVQRQLEIEWSDHSLAPDVVMIGYDPVVSAVDLTQADVVAAMGSVVTDEDGTRQATVMFMPGTTATITHADGTQEELPELSLRLTEYTVGEDGEAAMPGTLPPASAYTYAVEISSNEVLARGVKRNGIDTVLSQPVSYYLTNFLGFEAGTPVPVGYYDGDKGQWIADESGVVLDVLSTGGGVASIDSDGDGAADSAARLGALGITTPELEELARRYVSGDSLWRMRLSHFSSFDFNMGWGLPSDADFWDENPQSNVPNPSDCRNQEQSGKPWDGASGSIIECSEQILGESVPIVGTPFSLSYRSDRVPGRRASRIITVPVTGGLSMPSLYQSDVVISIAGKSYGARLQGNDRNQLFTAEWDGMDLYGRSVVGRQYAVVKVGYWFHAARYTAPSRFNSGASEGSSRITLVPSRRSAVLWRTKAVVGVENWDARSTGVGGWDVDVHHHYDRIGRNIRLGDGTVRTAATAPWQMRLLGSWSASDLESGPDGSLYGGYAGTVWRMRPNGEFSTVAGGGNPPDGLGDGGPATEARLETVLGLAVAGDGGIYIAENRSRIRYVSPDGAISTFAGNGEPEDWYESSGATYCDHDAPIHRSQATVSAEVLALAPDGTLYIGVGSACGLRKITTDGMVTRVTPPEWPRYYYNGRILRAGSGTMSVAKDGSVIVGYAEGCIVATSPNQGFGLLAGEAVRCRAPREPAGPAPDGAVLWAVPNSLAVDSRGDIYIVERRLVRRISGGVLTTLVELPPAFEFNTAKVAVTPDGKVFVSGAGQLLQLEPPLPDLSLDDTAVASEDGQQLFVFDAQGRHLRTVDTLLGFDIYNFGYNAAGRLATVRDAYGGMTTIAYDGSGSPASITGPFGQLTQLAVDGNGFLSQVTSPAGNAWNFIYDAGGLMRRSFDPRNSEHVFEYDSFGRLTSDTDPALAEQTLSRTDFLDEALKTPRVLKTGHHVTRSSAQGRTYGYREETLPTDERRQTSYHPDGTQSTFARRLVGALATTSPDGSTGSSTETGDPRFAMQSPLLATKSTKTPLGLQRITTQSRTAQLTNSTDPLSLVTLTEQNSVNGRTESTTFTRALRRTVTTTPAGRLKTVFFDALRNPTRSEIPGLSFSDYSYDARGRLISHKVGTGADLRETTFSYDSDGWLASITDAENRTVSFQRDLDGRVLSQVLPGNRVVGFGYDGNGNVVSVTPPGKPEHAFSHTPVDLMSSYEPPTLSSVPDPNTSYSYDLDRNITMVRRPDGLEIGYQYDGAGRLEYMGLPAAYGIPAEAVSYSYAPTTGQLETTSHSAGVSTSYAYDGFLVTSETTSGLGPSSLTLSRVYDSDFRLTTERIDGAWEATFGFDADSLLTRAGALTLTRNAQNGLLTGTSLGVVTDAWTYNGFAEPATYAASISSAEVFRTNFTRDKLGRITQKVETIDGVVSIYDYGYDAAGRLETVDKDGAQVSVYGYDLNGNRLDSFTSFPVPTFVSASYDDQDRLLTYGETTFTYTDNGELRTRTDNGDLTTYAYDVQGNLRIVDLPDGRRIEYLVDGRSRRVAKKINGILVQAFVYGSQLAPVAELDGSGSVVARFVYGTKGNVPEYLVRGGVTYRIATDHLGSLRLVIDANSGTVVQRMDYDEWGVVLSNTNPGITPFGFAGGLYDGDTELVRFGARDYDPNAGTWVSKDPILFSGGNVNLNDYCGDDPVNCKDPLGLYGSAACAYYQQACDAGGGSYECGQATWLCKKGPSGDDLFGNWGDCVRQCLQEKHRDRVLSPCSKKSIGGIASKENVADHAACFKGCAQNPENPYDANGEDLPDADISL